ncbi:MAG: glycosyltransferase family 87 protein [Anaerolineales bacterium]
MSIQRKVFLSTILILTLLALFYVQYDFAQKEPGGDDSVPRWLGAQAWLYKGISPYSDIVSQQSQTVISGRLAQGNQDKQLFVYPFYVIIFYLPVIWLPFNVARAIWMVLLELCTAGIVFFSAKTYNWSPPPWLLGVSIVLTVFMYNSVRTIILWQMAGVVAFLITFALWALKSNRDVLAGISLALATVKPQMVFLILPLLVIMWSIRKRTRFVLSVVISLALLAGFSFLAQPTWLADMLAQMKVYPSYSVIPALLYIFTGFFPASIKTVLQWALLAVFIIWLLWEWTPVLLHHREADYAIVLTLLITNIIVIRSATTNYLMMVPVFFFIFAIMEKTDKKKSYFYVLLLQLFYFIGIWVLFASTVYQGFETWPNYFPMPLLLLGGLIWARHNPYLISELNAKDEQGISSSGL